MATVGQLLDSITESLDEVRKFHAKVREEPGAFSDRMERSLWLIDSELDGIINEMDDGARPEPCPECGELTRCDDRCSASQDPYMEER